MLQGFQRVAVLVAVMVGAVHVGPAWAEPLRIIALGDSLTAGYGLAERDGFTSQLEAALRARGHDVTIVNAGVSGDTATGGLERLEWTLAEGADGLILELGANDALRGVDPAVTRVALEAILQQLQARAIPVLLAGMLAPPNLGADYAARFNPIYEELAALYQPVYYPFFLEGVAGNAALVLPDGLHPDAEGVQVIVDAILPSVEALIARIAER